MAGGTTLAEEARFFARQPGPWLVGLALAAAAVARISLGRWSVADLVIPAVILALEPFTEWLIHVFVLHAKPRRIGPWTYDSLAARKHRAHHADPSDRKLVFVPFPVLAAIVGFSAVLALAFSSRTTHALIGLTAGYAMLLAYEWTHFLIHSRYIPQRSHYRHLWRSHRLHHYRNENHWFGVTMTTADRILGTAPARDDVELSPTARTLGIQEARR